MSPNNMIWLAIATFFIGALVYINHEKSALAESQAINLKYESEISELKQESEAALDQAKAAQAKANKNEAVLNNHVDKILDTKISPDCATAMNWLLQQALKPAKATK